MKKIVFIFVSGFFLTALCSAQERIGEINRGIFHQEGIASWYGEEFNGRLTSSGEIFNDKQFTAAHPILPFGTMLKITNQHNNKTVIVRVNDRGPFVGERIIDLSRSAAEELDMLRTGTAPVIVESLHEVSIAARPAQGTAQPVQTVQSTQTTQPTQATQAIQPTQATQAIQPTQPQSTLPVHPGEAVQVRQASVEPFSGGEPLSTNLDWQGSAKNSGTIIGSVIFHPAIPAAANGKNYMLQVGAYKKPEYAIEAFEKLKKAGFNPRYERFGEYSRVIIGGIRYEELKITAERLGNAGFREVLLREE